MQSLKEAGFLANFLGAMIDSLTKEGYTPADAKHLVVASLLEIVEDMTVKPDGGHDFYVVKPVFRFLINLFQEEKRLLQADAYLPQVQQKLQEYDIIINYFTLQLKAIEENMAGGNHDRP